MTITKKNINILAAQLVSYTKKNKKLPKSISINKIKYTYPEMGYIFPKFINNLNKDVNNIKVATAPKASGESVDLTIKEKDYKKIAKSLTDFIEKNKRLPNYITFDGKKIKQRVFIYSFAKIIVFYDINKRLPSTCTFKTSEVTKASESKSSTNNNSLHEYLTSQGCSGMGQCTPYNCADNSLQQCFYRLTGILVDESSIASVAGTTTSGTDHEGINTAIVWFNRKYNQNIKITWKNFSDLGSSASERWATLNNYIKKGALFCHLKYRNTWGHYEVPKAVNDSTVTILNSLGNKCTSVAYCGYIETRSKSDQLSYINGISQKSIAILTKG